ncbi:hypothetical protein SAMN02745127_01501 [Oceanospirillum multiglobuliferum]|uniref:Copper-binding protein n=1 Tax=Oceanospirillum multiglobuliferum TaxID=64969 RepID=A0A1T4PJ76_9GAMM|nr:copper-binding protein [Oceanospirillum multiglobuliferum]OPX55545.1 copper-binding protein [Oceanospirillum multiglobuliferum]SJZ90918.1 hypothetical protein SAMN02745127_01501 [Oceanospirillum multiglobuliferum]
MMSVKHLLASSLLLLSASTALAEGDLTRKPVELPELILGTEESGYGLSQTEYQLETGKAYRLTVTASGLKPYALKAPAFFTSIYLRKIEVGAAEIKAVSLTELEFEDAGEAELFFVPIKPGQFPFYIDGLEHKGMTGNFVVR